MKLFTSVKTIILSLIVGVLLFTAAAFMLATGQEVFKVVKNLEGHAQKNVLKVVSLNIEAGHKWLILSRKLLMQDRKERLRTLVDVVTQMVDGFYTLSEQGVLSKEQAQAKTLEIIENLRFGDDDYFFVYNENHVVISHPDPSVRGKDMSKTKDIHGENLFRALDKHVDENGFGYTVISRKVETRPEPVEKMIYCVVYPKWKWIIGGGLDIPDVEAIIKTRQTAIIEDVKKQIEKMKNAATGYYWLFDGNRRILVDPTLSGQDASDIKDPSDVKDPVTGRDLIQELMNAADDPNKTLHHYWYKPNDSHLKFFNVSSRVKYFKNFDWYLVSSVYDDETRQPAINVVMKQAFIIIGIVLLCVCGAYFLVKKLSHPLDRLTTHADKLIENDFSPIEGAAEELSSITFPIEAERLAKTMRHMEMELQAHIKNIRKETAAKERMHSELRIAREIQMSMLPKDIEKKEFTENIEVAAEVLPARAVGGDFYDYFFIDETRICLVVGDVADKGIPASLFMALCKALIRAVATINNQSETKGNSPGEILTEVNLALCRGNEMLMFVTVFLGILDLKAGELLYSNAGHNPPYLLSASGTCTEIRLPPGKPLGISKSTRYQTFRGIARPGDTLFAYTDGVNEATDTHGELYGEERIESFLKTCSDKPIISIVKGIFESIEIFTKGAPQADDVTVLVVRYWKELHGLKEEMTLRIKNDVSKIESAKEALTRFAEANGLKKEIIFKLCLALEEIVYNIISYAFDDDNSHFISVLLSVLPDKIAMEIRDKGKPFNPIEKGAPNFERSFKEKSQGGVGLYLVTQFMDETEYRREFGENIFVMKKAIPEQAQEPKEE